MTTYDLDEATAPVTLDANGFGQSAIQPNGTEKWLITRYAVSVDQDLSQTVMPTCKLYKGTPSPQSFLDGTYTGAQDAGDCSISLEKNQPITAVWENGIPGTHAVLSVFGTRELYN